MLRKNSPIIITIPSVLIPYILFLSWCFVKSRNIWNGTYKRTWKGIHFCRFSEKPYIMCFIWLETIWKKNRPRNSTYDLKSELFLPWLSILWFISHPVIIRNLATIEYWCHCVLWTGSIFTNGNFSNGHD